MPRYTVELDGKRITLEGDRPPTEQEVRSLLQQQPAEQPIAQAVSPEEPVAPTFSQRQAESAARTEQLIEDRPSLIPTFAKRAAQTFADPKKMIAPNVGQQAQNALTLLLGLGSAFEAAESVPANVGLAAQRGTMEGVGDDILMGLTGRRPAQVGDIARASGIPAIEGTAPITGLIATSPGLGAKGAGTTARVAQKVLSAPTALPVKAINTLIGAPVRVGEELVRRTFKGLKSKSPVEKMANFAFDTTLKIKERAKGFYVEANKVYGQTLEAISEKVGGAVPVDNVKSSAVARLQELGFVDESGKLTEDALKLATAKEKKVIEFVRNLKGDNIAFSDLVRRLQNLKKAKSAAARKGTRSIDRDERLINSILKDVGEDMEEFGGRELADLNRSHAQKLNLFEQINSKFKVFKGDVDSGTGERFLINFADKTKGEKQFLKQAEEALSLKFTDDTETLARKVQQIEALESFPVLGRAFLGGEAAIEMLGQGMVGARKAVGRTSVPPAIMRDILGVNLE